MSKRIKYAKLRLVKTADAGPSSVGTGEDAASTNKDVGAMIVKGSKYFANEPEDRCVDENTFFEVDVENPEDGNVQSNGQCSRRRTNDAIESCLNDGPKLPKLRKKASKGNVLISDFLNSHTPKDDDFEEPKSSASGQPNQTKIQRIAKKPRVPKQLKKQADIRKVFRKYKTDHEVLQELLKEHGATEQVDPEQLQMALAMSRSLADQGCSSISGPCEEIQGQEAFGSSVSSEERRIVGIRTTLEQFGFRCKNSYTDYDLNVIFGSAASKNVKKIKHKRATNLQRRTREELLAFIDDRAKKLFPPEMIASDGQRPPSLVEDNECSLSHLFWIAKTGLTSEQLMERYYVPELLEMNPAPVGCMLKDWSAIPGRESTPERNECVMTEQILIGSPCAVEEDRVCVMSPDLFDECDLEQKSMFNRSQCDKTGDKSPDEKNDCSFEKPGAHSFNTCQNGNNAIAMEQIDANNDTVKKSLQEPVSSSYDEEECTDVPRKASAESIDDKGLPEVITIEDTSDDEEEHFVTAPESEPISCFHRSSENIFEDTDPNPMVSFEVYSSEEEKISAASRARIRAISPNGDFHKRSSAPFDMGDGQCNSHELNECLHQSMPVERCISAPGTVEKSSTLFALDPMCNEKDLSFHRLAIKARLSEAFQKSAVETVDLIGDSPAGDPEEGNNPMPVEASTGFPVEAQVSTASSQCINDEDEDEVLCISDDEVNYSVQGDISRARLCDTELRETEPTFSREVDSDNTVLYYNIEATHLSRTETIIEAPASENYCAEVASEVLSISTNEDAEDPVAGNVPVNYAEDTFAYLEGLVKQFKLPPIRSQRNGCDVYGGLSQPEAHKLDVGSSGLFAEEKFDARNDVDVETNRQWNTDLVTIDDVQLNGTMDTACHDVPDTTGIVDELSNYLDNYIEPDFADHEIEAETLASQGNMVETVGSQGRTSKMLSRVKSSNELESPRNRPLKRIASESFLISSSTPKEKDSTQAKSTDGFQNKFNDLKTATKKVAPPEFMICTTNVPIDTPSFEDMSTPELERELFKYGLKDLNRSKAIKVLKHIFEEMHPFVEVIMQKEIDSPSVVRNGQIGSSKQTHIAPSSMAIDLTNPQKRAFKFDENVAECFLPSKPRKKMHWCAVPLHVSFFNLVSECDELQRQILKFEPINLDTIYGMLKSAGMRYETNDLIAFLDKHCITFRTSASGSDRTAKAKAPGTNKTS